MKKEATIMTPKFLSPLLIILTLGISVQIRAQLPVDPTVIHGAAAIDTIGNHMTVTNSPGTILNWQSFSIGPDGSVYFNQQDVNSQVLNRVTGGDPSEIFGHLGSNGGVWLINPYGVLFGPNARVDVASLVASTLDISNIDFLAGRYQFNTANGLGEIKNQGEIRTTFGGRVWLMGNSVSNESLVQAPDGQIVLAAGESIEFVDSGAPNVVVRVRAPENETVNLGTLVASDGSIDLHGSIVNQEGFVRADSIGDDGLGQIVLKASDALMLAENSLTQAENGTIRVESDTIDNRGAIGAHTVSLAANDIMLQGQIAAPGGDVTLQAERLTYLAGSVDVSNAQGAGGEIHLNTGKLEGMASGILRADGELGGVIRIEGKNSIAFSSTLEATGVQRGGTIEVTGDSVILLNADVDASSGSQGGAVHLGGGWQGSGDLPHAREVIVGVGSEVKANGADNGGEIAVWSTQNSEHYGSLQARDGGRIELSSKGGIRQMGEIVAGSGGEVLFDPKNLIIIDSPPDGLVLARKVTSGSVIGQPVLTDNDQFGFSVALDGDRMAIGTEVEDIINNTGLKGAVYLFSGAGSDFSGLTLRGKLSDGTINMPALDVLGGFGSSLALDGDHLAVGAPRSESGRGAVYLFHGVGSDFSNLTYGTRLDSTLLSNNQFAALDPLDFFGFAVALDGNRLAVGATRDDGNSLDQTADFGAVYFFDGVNSANITPRAKLDAGSGHVSLNQGDLFGRSLALEGNRLVVGAPGGIPTNTQGYSGKVYLLAGVNSVYNTSNLSGLVLNQELSVTQGVPNLSVGDGFGFSVALQNDHLLIGAPGANGLRGRVYLYSGAAGDFTAAPVLVREIPPYNSADQPSSNDLFGGSVAIDGDRFAVGAYSDDTGGNNRGAVYLFTGLNTLNSLGGISIQEANFGFNASDTSYITPATLKAQLDQGSSVTLQANNDITVKSAVTVDYSGSGGNLTMQAGRDITFEANITTDNGNLTAVAGDQNAIPAYIDFDSTTRPTLSINNGVSLNVGSGTATLAAINGNFINHHGDQAITTNGGRWLIYADDPASSIEGFTNYSKHYDEPFVTGTPPTYANTGNWFLYSVAPVLQVSAPATVITYGDDIPNNIAPLITGFIDGDSAADVQGFAGITWDGNGPRSSAGKLTQGVHDIRYVAGLATDLGYQFADNTNNTDELTVNAKIVSALSFVANDKEYDGNRNAVITAGTLSGVIQGDVVSLTGTGAFDTKNVGTNKTVNLTGGSLSGADGGNYSLSQQSLNTVSAFADITPKTITVGSASAEDKIYDGNTKATFSDGVLDGVITGDSVFISSAQAVFDDKNVGVDKKVTVSGIVLDGTDRSNYELGPNSTVTTTADITPKSLTVANFIAQDKVYNGNRDAVITDGTLSGVIQGDVVSLTGTGAFDTKNVGIDKTVKLTGGSLSGADGGNYSLSQQSLNTVSAFADITPKTITVGSASAEDKIYDGNTKATFSEGMLDGVIAGDSVFISSAQAVFDDKNAGVDKKVTVSGIVLDGTDISNYELRSDSAVTTTADITPKSLTVDNVSVQDKIYDGRTDAQLANNQSTLGGRIEGDDVTLAGGVVAFETKDAGANKSIIVTNAVLTGGDSKNYRVEDGLVSSSASITQRKIGVESFTAENKVYDGELTATIIDGVLSDDVIPGDNVELSGKGAFEDKNVGTGKTVVLTDGSLVGPDSKNYDLENIDDVKSLADITHRTVTVGDISEVNKTYDGNVNVVTRIIAKLNNLIFGDDVSLDNTATFDSQDVGDNKIVTLTNFSLSGIDSGNYVLDGPNSASTIGRITHATLTYNADTAKRVVGDTLTGLTGNVTGFVSGENLANATTGTLIWETTANNNSPAGIYPIYGGGLSAKNYQFIQNQKNDTALALQVFDFTNPRNTQPTTNTSTQAVNAAASAALETKTVLASLEKGGTIDIASSLAPSATSNFGRVNLSRLSRQEMQLLIDYRKDFKEILFADSIHKLELDPGLADVPPCASLELVDSGFCRISDIQRQELKSKVSEALPQKNRQQTVISVLPEIERKLIVLFGVDQYADNTIPPLDNSISDAQALGELFVDQLGYEVRIVKNATRVDIIRTLNQLAAEMEDHDSVVVYYAGHGFLNEKTGSGYWIPADAAASDPTSWISNSSISEMLAGISSKQMVMISDSCYSGAFTKEKKVELSQIEMNPVDILAKRTVVVMSSGSDEPVADEGRGGHSIFAWFLMQSLRNIDTWKIGTNVFEQVQMEVRNSFPQTPQYGAAVSAGHEMGGDYLFEFRKLMGIQ